MNMKALKGSLRIFFLFKFLGGIKNDSIKKIDFQSFKILLIDLNRFYGFNLYRQRPKNS